MQYAFADAVWIHKPTQETGIARELDWRSSLSKQQFPETNALCQRP